MRLELHCHTYYSKGSKIPWESLSSPKDVIKTAKRKGLDGIAITDHRTTKAWKEAKQEAKKQGLLFIPGVELDTKDGHLIALGINESIENRLSLMETIDIIHSQGGIVVAPHPYDIKGEGIKNGIKYVDVVEVFNSLNLDKFSNYIALKRAKLFGKPMCAGSDAHSLEMIANSVNIIKGHNADSVLKNLKKGNMSFVCRYAQAEDVVDWVRERMKMSYTDILRYVDENYWGMKAALSKIMLNRFVNSDNPAWITLAKFSLGISCIYGAFKVLTY